MTARWTFPPPLTRGLIIDDYTLMVEYSDGRKIIPERDDQRVTTLIRATFEYPERIEMDLRYVDYDFSPSTPTAPTLPPQAT